MVHWQVFSFFWLDTVPECRHVLSRRGVGKALGYLSIWKPWSMHQHHTSSLQACYLCRAHYPADSDRQTGVRQIGDAEKSLSGHQGCTSWTTRTMQTHVFPIITANVLFLFQWDLYFVIHAYCFASHIDLARQQRGFPWTSGQPLFILHSITEADCTH